MLHIYNGIFKDDKIKVDVVQINPADYDLDCDCIWFDVGVSISKSVILLSSFRFYLADSNKTLMNPVAVVESPHYDKEKVSLGVLVGFEFKPDFFYSIPVLGFYCDTYKRVELVKLTC